jgi:hypothetical protein
LQHAFDLPHGKFRIRIVGSNISAAIAAAKHYPLDWQHVCNHGLYRTREVLQSPLMHMVVFFFHYIHWLGIYTFSYIFFLPNIFLYTFGCAIVKRFVLSIY